jgi:oligoribonuclease NrnB/cAMP/cGMP phosphodiesterase (DHH superfamily)
MEAGGSNGYLHFLGLLREALGMERRALEEGDLKKVAEALEEKERLIRQMKRFNPGEGEMRAEEVLPLLEELSAEQEENVRRLEGLMKKVGSQAEELRKRMEALRSYGGGERRVRAAYLNGRA